MIDTLIRLDDGGLLVKETEKHLLTVYPMMFNFRLCTTRRDLPQVYDRFWCYAGRDPIAMHRAVAAALAWDGADDTEPEGWNKNGQTGEWREPTETEEPR